MMILIKLLLTAYLGVALGVLFLCSERFLLGSTLASRLCFGFAFKVCSHPKIDKC